ncbi:hypothetical protein [Floridanema evergladense]|uniref:Uncharacterized protein n=1 Tax=Floridaenema evergladense BLCC-F167 TaxID=3153639 RepID=A0ABV4WG88_9CYAN
MNPIFFETGDVISGLQRETKMVRDNHYCTLKSSKSLPEKWGINFGNIKSTQPLNCSCGSKNLRYTKGKSSNGIQAWCRDCGANFPVAKVLATFLEHLVEPEPEPKKVICRECQNSVEVIDSTYYQCWNCGGKILRINPNSS